MNSKVWIVLIFCNVMWSAVFSIAKPLLEIFSPLELAFTRFFLAAVPLLAASLWGGRHSLLARWWKDASWFDLRIVLVGGLSFFVSPVTQMKALTLTGAMDSALLVSTQPLLTIIMAALILRERLTRTRWFAIGCAFAGAAVLSGVTWEKLRALVDPKMVGNGIFMISMLAESMYSVLTKPILLRRHPVVFFTLAIWTGLAMLALYAGATGSLGHGLGLAVLTGHFSGPVLARFAFMSWVATLTAYFGWIWALKRASVSALAFSLYIQPILGVFWGWLLLDERLSGGTIIGAAMILFSLALSARRE